MICRFCSFVIDVSEFISRQYKRIHVVFVARINLLQYQVFFVRV